MLDQHNITVETVTPKVAFAWLENNRRNRTLRQEVVDMYAEQMTAGEWRMTGDPIRFSESGTLLDGQHRLAAILQSGAFLPMVIVRGLDLDDQMVIDTGVRRSFGDHLKIIGEPYSNHLAAMVRGVTLFETNGNLVANRVPHSVLKETLNKYPEIRDGISTVYKVNQETSLGFNAGGYGWWRFSQLDKQDCKKFFDQFASGADLQDGNPILTLRKIFLADIRGRRNFNFRANFKAAIMTKAWNKWRAGETAQALRWQGGGTHGEAFPEAV